MMLGVYLAIYDGTRGNGYGDQLNFGQFNLLLDKNENNNMGAP